MQTISPAVLVIVVVSSAATGPAARGVAAPGACARAAGTVAAVAVGCAATGAGTGGRASVGSAAVRVGAVSTGVCTGAIESSTDETAERPSSNRAWGLTLGFPQLLALTLETSRDRAARVQLSASPLLLINSLTARVILTRANATLAPYVYVGAGLLNTAEGEGGGAIGTTGFLWTGAGLAYQAGWVELFGELGVVDGMDESKGYEHAIPAGAVGILFGR